MLVETEAQIYLSNQRGTTLSEGCRSLHTLNSGSYHAEGREPFGRLLTLNDETLDTGRSSSITTSKTIEIILIPIVGGLELVDSYGESIFVSPGETFRFLAFPESGFIILNPYPVETINYLQIHLRPETVAEDLENYLDDLPLKTMDFGNTNALEPIFSSSCWKVSAFIGQYAGREEGLYKIQNFESGIFAYIILGAFEVQNRLLEKGDALSLLRVEEVEFEALSNGAIILLMEIGI